MKTEHHSVNYQNMFHYKPLPIVVFNFQEPPFFKSLLLLLSLAINPFHAFGLFLYPLKISENQRFPNVFRVVQKETSGMTGVNDNKKIWKHVLTLMIDKCSSIGRGGCWELCTIMLLFVDILPKKENISCIYNCKLKQKTMSKFASFEITKKA